MNKGLKFIFTVAGVAAAIKIAEKVMKEGNRAGVPKDEYNYDPQTGEPLKKSQACEPEVGEVVFMDYRFDPMTGEPLE